MNSAKIHYERSVQDLSLFYSNSKNYVSLKESNISAAMENNNQGDNLNLSDTAKGLKELGLNLKSFAEIQNNTNINFNYDFSNLALDVFSSGNFNLHSQSGSLSIQIDFTKFFDTRNKSGKTPYQLKISLDFTTFEKDIKSENGTYIQKPDILKLVTSIIKKVLEEVKDGQDKDIKLAFENGDTIRAILDLDNGKIGKLLLSWLFLISKIQNPNDKDGKRDKVIILIPDTTVKIKYNSTDINIKMNNIRMEFSTNGILEDGTIDSNETDTAETEKNSETKMA